jgi:hypothetical protein
LIAPDGAPLRKERYAHPDTRARTAPGRRGIDPRGSDERARRLSEIRAVAAIRDDRIDEILHRRRAGDPCLAGYLHSRNFKGQSLRIRGGAFVAIGDDSRIPSRTATRSLLWASTLRSHALEQHFFQVGATSHVPAPSQLIFSARGRALAEGCARLSLSGVYHALRGRRRDQARRIGIAARTTRTLAKTLRVLECRPGADRDAGEREFDTNASRRARTLRSH